MSAPKAAQPTVPPAVPALHHRVMAKLAEKGPAYVLSRAAARAWDAIMLVPGFAGSLIIRALSPVVTVRIGWMRVDRMGHWPVDLAGYLAEHAAAAANGLRSVDLFYYRAPVVANTFMDELTRRHLFVWRFLRHVDRANGMLPGAERHRIFVTVRDRDGSRDFENVISGHGCPYDLTEADLGRARREIERLGVDPAKPFVCVLVRDSSYLGMHLPDEDFSRHDCRNADIRDFEPTVRYLLDAGFAVFRMGKSAERPLAIDHPDLVDIPFVDHDDILDLYLSSRCAFFISTGTGIDQIANLFDRPVFMIDYVSLDGVMWWSPNILTAFKPITDAATGERLDLEAVVRRALPTQGFPRSVEQYAALGCVLQNLSAAEILSVVKEFRAVSAAPAADPNAETGYEGFWRALAELHRARGTHERIPKRPPVYLSRIHQTQAPAGAIASGAARA